MLISASEISGGAGYIQQNIYQAYLLEGNLPRAQQYWETAAKDSSVPPEEALLLLPYKTAP